MRLSPRNLRFSPRPAVWLITLLAATPVSAHRQEPAPAVSLPKRVPAARSVAFSTPALSAAEQAALILVHRLEPASATTRWISPTPSICCSKRGGAAIVPPPQARWSTASEPAPEGVRPRGDGARPGDDAPRAGVTSFGFNGARGRRGRLIARAGDPRTGIRFRSIQAATDAATAGDADWTFAISSTPKSACAGVWPLPSGSRARGAARRFDLHFLGVAPRSSRLRRVGRCFARAIDIFEATRGPDYPDLAAPLERSRHRARRLDLQPPAVLRARDRLGARTTVRRKAHTSGC